MISGRVALLVVAAAGVSFALGRGTVPQLSAKTGKPANAPAVVEALIDSVPVISEAEAEDLRASNYSSVDSIEKILELPTDYAQTEALYILAGRAGQSELEELVQQSMSIVDRYDRAAALSILFSRYAELDADAAVDYLVSINLDISERIFPSVFEHWSRTDLNAAIAKANSLTNLRERKSASRAILMATARYNESLIDTVAASLDASENVEQIRGEAISARANRDPLGALQEALSLSGTSGRYGTVWKVARVWARNDPVGALQSLDLIADAGMREHFVGQVVERWIQDDPELAMQFINAESDPHYRNVMMKRALGVYAESNPENAMLLAVEMKGQSGARALQQVMYTWATKDPAAAMLALGSIENTTMRNRIIQHVGQNLTSQGADKALAWLDALDPETRSSQMDLVLTSIARNEPRRALEYVMNNATDDTRSEALLSILYSASALDPTIVQDYITQLPAGTNTDSVYQQIASNLTMGNRQASLRWIDGLSGSAKTSALKGAVLALTHSDPDYAATLMDQLPDEAITTVFQQVGVQMSHTDPAGALSWLEQFSGRNGYEAAVTDVIQRVAYSDPQSAATLAQQSRGRVRDSVYGSVAASWARSAPRQATRWAMSLPAGTGRDYALGSLVSSLPADIPSVSGVISSIASDDRRNTAIRRGYARMLGKDNNQALASAFLNEVGASQELRDQLNRGNR